MCVEAGVEEVRTGELRIHCARCGKELPVRYEPYIGKVVDAILVKVLRKQKLDLQVRPDFPGVLVRIYNYARPMERGGSLFLCFDCFREFKEKFLGKVGKEEDEMLWTEREVEILKKLYPAGVPLEEIAKVLKSRTLAAIQNKAQQLGLKRKTGGEIDEEYYNKLVEVFEL